MMRIIVLSAIVSAYALLPDIVGGSRVHTDDWFNVHTSNNIRILKRGSPTQSKPKLPKFEADNLIEDYPMRSLDRVDAGYENKTAAMNIRFNKFEILSGGLQSEILLPLGEADYSPMVLYPTGRFLREQTTAISVFHVDDSKECVISPSFVPAKLLEATHIVLTHPSHDPNSPYWNELWEVIIAQIARRRDENVEDWLRLPLVWHNYSLHEVAMAVHDEYPGVYHGEHLKYLFGGSLDRIGNPNCDECANIDRNIIPDMSNFEFIRGVVMLADLNTWAFGAIGPISFSVKWNYGRARPEEVVWAIYTGKIGVEDGVPDHIVDTIRTRFDGMNTPFDFTAYVRGCPNHPSFPAMHASASAASLWMAVVMDLTVKQLCQVKELDYAIAYARTVAGVHYPSDNIAGLNIGQEILSQLLPRYLHDKYGSDVYAVQQKIEAIRFDWTEYLTGECFSDDVGATL